MFCGPKIICIAIHTGVRAISFLYRKQQFNPRATANRLIILFERPSILPGWGNKFIIGARAIFAHDKRNNAAVAAQKAICDSCTRGDSSLFLPLFLSPKWFTRGNKQGSANPGKKAPRSSAYVTFQSRCTGTLPLCFMRFRHARSCEQASHGDDPTPLFPRHYCHDEDCSNSRTIL